MSTSRDAAIANLREVASAAPSPSPLRARPNVAVPTCICAAARVGKTFLDHHDSVDGADKGQVLEGCDLVSRSFEAVTSRYRCRVCGTDWTEERVDSGQMWMRCLRPS